MRRSSLLWLPFFIICMVVGFLHGFLPQGISRDYFIKPTKIRILVSDETLLSKDIQTYIEHDLKIKIETTVTRDWDAIQAKIIAQPTQDILIIPSYWAHTLGQQGLLQSFTPNDTHLPGKIAPDFLSSLTTKGNYYFFPIYWIKTGFKLNGNTSFDGFLKDKKTSTLFLLADEDLILNHFKLWTDSDQMSLVQQKKILTLQLDQLNNIDPKEGALEVPINEKNTDLVTDQNLSSLLVWGAAIPLNSENKQLALEVLDTMTETKLQGNLLTQTPFNTTLITVSSAAVPMQRRANQIRDLKLKDTLIIDKKDQDAVLTLKNNFNLNL